MHPPLVPSFLVCVPMEYSDVALPPSLCVMHLAAVLLLTLPVPMSWMLITSALHSSALFATLFCVQEFAPAPAIWTPKMVTNESSRVSGSLLGLVFVDRISSPTHRELVAEAHVVWVRAGRADLGLCVGRVWVLWVL